MSTYFINSGQNELWRLDSDDITVLFAVCADNTPRMLHYGELLSHDETDSVAAAVLPGWPHGTLDERSQAALLPQAASCFGGHPALLAHFNSGSIDQSLTLQEVHEGDSSLKFVFANQFLQLETNYSLHSGGALVANTNLRNISGHIVHVDWVAAASLELPAKPLEVESYHGRWGQEFQRRRHALDEAAPILENRRGRSSHQLFPGLLVGEPNFDATRGCCYAMQLAWSGNYKLITQRQFDGRAVLQAGVLYSPGEVLLEPGQKLDSPVVVFSYGEGSDACAWRYHRYAREHHLPRWTRSDRPIHANSWEAMYFDLDLGELYELVDAAVAIGAERFVLDDGWFQGRRDDTAGLGDWWVDLGIFPDGLKPLVDHIRAAGLQFGLWFEPEMVNVNSTLFKDHPDWVLSHSGAQMRSARQQWVLDVARPEVSDYLFEKISTLIENYNIDYIKWDMNRDLPAAGNESQPRAALQPKAVYALMDRLNTLFPKLEIETCASGGARCDLGVLAYTGRIWTSDNNDPVDRFRIHQAASQFIPPEILGAHIGPQRAHLTGRDTPIHTRAILAMTGQFGYELDPRELSQDQTELLKSYAELYKKHRGWLREARLHQLTDLWQGLLASVFVAKNSERAIVALMTECSLDTAIAGQLRVPGLDKETIYRVELIIADRDELQRRNRQLPPWMSTIVRLSGAFLAVVGLALPVLSPHAGLLILCEYDK